MAEALLRRITQALESEGTPDAILHLAATTITSVFDIDRCKIYVANDNSGEYTLAASNHEIKKTNRTMAYGSGLVGWVAERAELINLGDVTVEQHYKAANSNTNYRSFLGAPVSLDGKIIAIIVLEREQTGHFSESAEAMLVTTCASFATRSGVVLNFLNALPNQPGRQASKKNKLYDGIAGAPGVAIGRAVVVFPKANFEQIPDRTVKNTQEQWDNFHAALTQARHDIRELSSETANKLNVTERALFEAYARMLDSRSLVNDVKTEINAGQWAPGALKHVINKRIAQFTSLDDEYLRERASDVREIGLRILSHLQSNDTASIEVTKKSIIVSEDLSATTLLEIPKDKIRGLVSASGSANSHVAILARSLGIPTIMGLASVDIRSLEGMELVIDGYSGLVITEPDASIKREYKALAAEEEQLTQDLQSICELPVATSDNHEVKLLVNTGLAIDVDRLTAVGAQGVGLYRTEIPFMMRERFPSEEEQRLIYRELLESMHPNPVIMRTLDIGGDKNLPYFPVEEANPFLGWRGIRISLDHPELFLAQIRAMLRASQGLDNLAIMLPMISSVSELERALPYISQAYDELVLEGVTIKYPKIGVMIEVPSAVFQAYELAKRVDFISVGSNDLTQYLLAIDRNNAKVAKYYESMHPAVLRALKQIIKGAKQAKRPVGICGELAADPLAAILLVALGFDSLSMNARSLLRIKWVISRFTMARAKELLAEVMKMDDAREVSVHMEMALDEAGLGGLIRAGKQ
jgi:phosphotransferase system, enzyme I, PtsP